jgi:hypothetical protein
MRLPPKSIHDYDVPKLPRLGIFLCAFVIL